MRTSVRLESGLMALAAISCVSIIDDLRERVLQGGTNEEILEWCFQNGRRRMRATCLSGMDSRRNSDGAILSAPVLEKRKKKHGIADRTDILTIADLIDFDEGRFRETIQDSVTSSKRDLSTNNFRRCHLPVPPGF